uniref:Uncharacterized protein n=1 Tax=Ditylenchus dipsaci TaxID=166011 RepID=A0A915CZQ0_9BILA
MIIQSSVASSRKKSSNRAKQSVCGALPAASRRGVSLAPSFAFEQDSLHSYSSSNSVSSSDDECGSVVGEDYSLLDLSDQNLGWFFVKG